LIGVALLANSSRHQRLYKRHEALFMLDSEWLSFPKLRRHCRDWPLRATQTLRLDVDWLIVIFKKITGYESAHMSPRRLTHALHAYVSDTIRFIHNSHFFLYRQSQTMKFYLAQYQNTHFISGFRGYGIHHKKMRLSENMMISLL
jgi:hypothetical protein